MKRNIYTFVARYLLIAGILALPGIAAAQNFTPLQPFITDGSGNITQRVASAPLKLTGISDGCLTIASSIVGSQACGSGGNSFGYLFPGNATTTNIQFNGGITLGTLNGLVGVNNGLTYAVSTSSLTASITGNAATATALQNARTINGVSFNGTANIVVASTTLLGDSNTFSGTLNKFSNAPALALSGLVKGNGTAAATAAVNGTDFTLLTANTCGANQFFNSATAAGVLGCGTPTGGGNSFSYPFPLLGIGTTSPIMLLASTTIGNGTQTNGLTISGGSTTTLNAYFAGKVGIGTSSPETSLTIQSTATGDDTPAFTIDGSGTSNGNGDMELEANTSGTAEANIDYARQGTVEWQLGIQNGGGTTGNDFELWDGSNNPVFTINHSSLDVNIGTTTCNGETELCVWGDGGVSSSIFQAITSASSSALSIANTGFATTTVSGLNISGSATSTSNVGFNITGGCYGVRGTCLTQNAGTVTSVGLSDSNSTLTIGSTPVTTSGTITATLNLAHSNTWSALQNFSNATSTLFSSTYASSTNAFFGSATIASLGIAAGQFAAFDPTGKLIGTTTPSGSNSAFSPSANYATTGALPSNNYVAGVITAVANGALSVDGASPSVGQRVLVKNEGTAANNGLYDVTTAGSAIAAFVLTRDAQYNSSSNIIPGIVTYIISGSTNADDFWAMTSAAPITVGTTALNYTEVSGGGANVTSVSNSDSTITFSPTTGAVVGSLNLGHSNIWTALQTINFASTTALSASSELVIPNGATKGSTVAGQTELDTTNDQLKIGDGSATAVFDPRVSFTFGIATTTAWTGPVTAPTVTIPMGLTWTQISCTVQPSGATLTAQYQYANPSTYATVNITSIPASTTPGVYALTSNNTPTANATSTITFSSPSGSPTSAACTLTGTVSGT